MRKQAKLSTYFGIKRDSVSNSGHSTTVENRITSARGCIQHILMGAGLHGEDGGIPRVSLSLWSTYVLPSLAYGSDVWTLSNSEIQKLNQFHKKKSPSRSCISTREQLTQQYTYCSGRLPLVADIHRCVLSTLESVLRSNSIERVLTEG